MRLGAYNQQSPYRLPQAGCPWSWSIADGCDETTMTATPDELVHTLDALGVPFLTSSAPGVNAPISSSVELLEALASAPEARLRLALIPLLLRHPEFAAQTREASAHLSGDARLTLMLFYTAARLLQQKYSAALDEVLGTRRGLPDLFSFDLGLGPSTDVNAALRQLAERHASLLGLSANWAGAYEHATKKFIGFLKLRAQWTQARDIHTG